MSQKGFTLWFTGLSGAGKTTLADRVYDELKGRRVLKVEKLDGDVVRTNLSKGLGFSKEDRDTNIRRIGFVYVEATLDTLVQRDVKGLYKKALAGEIKEFTGVSDPYEAPLHPEVHVNSSTETIDESFDAIIGYLEARGLIEPLPEQAGYSAAEEQAVSAHLEALGYL